ncbi:hypothetical protein ACFXTN_032460 [Malus domestica]|uniref:DUF1279 domain-containing protein n=1 Tax=Malus domestica TaxID=3750 RepID=A0A498JWV1_MALDO|nr:hypothetical protein DVH24_010589 [Malus domestica]
MALVAIGGRFKELLKKYGKVALGVHFLVSTASIASLYVAIKSNVGVESLPAKLHMGNVSFKDETPPSFTSGNRQSTAVVVENERNRTAELTASTGGALKLALLCNKALLPIRVPIPLFIKTGGLRTKQAGRGSCRGS